MYAARLSHTSTSTAIHQFSRSHLCIPMGVPGSAASSVIACGPGWLPAAVTTNLNINFLKKPAARDLVAEARLIKVGNRLAVAEIGIRSDGAEELVAHATGTYSISAVQ